MQRATRGVATAAAAAPRTSSVANAPTCLKQRISTMNEAMITESADFTIMEQLPRNANACSNALKHFSPGQ